MDTNELDKANIVLIHASIGADRIGFYGAEHEREVIEKFENGMSKLIEKHYIDGETKVKVKVVVFNDDSPLKIHIIYPVSYEWGVETFFHKHFDEVWENASK